MNRLVSMLIKHGILIRECAAGMPAKFLAFMVAPPGRPVVEGK